MDGAGRVRRGGQSVTLADTRNSGLRRAVSTKLGKRGGRHGGKFTARMILRVKDILREVLINGRGMRKVKSGKRNGGNGITPTAPSNAVWRRAEEKFDRRGGRSGVSSTQVTVRRSSGQINGQKMVWACDGVTNGKNAAVKLEADAKVERRGVSAKMANGGVELGEKSCPLMEAFVNSGTVPRVKAGTRLFLKIFILTRVSLLLGKK